jgi:hypothetical protein
MENFALTWLKLTVFTEIVIFAQTFGNHFTIKRIVYIDLNYDKCYFLKVAKKDELSCLSECNRDDQCSSFAYSNDSNCFLYSYYKESSTNNVSGILVNLYKKTCKPFVYFLETFYCVTFIFFSI